MLSAYYVITTWGNMTIDEKDPQGTRLEVQVLTMLLGRVISSAVCGMYIAAKLLIFCNLAGLVLAVIGLILLIVTGQSIKGPHTISTPQ